jgi:hypothetical protein
MSYLYGVDVSAYQGSNITGWLDARDFCFVKITEGQHTVDSGWSSRISQVRDAGLVVGAYHFAHPENPVSGDAQNFITTYGPALKPGDLIALDWEITGGLSWSSGTAWKDAWIKQVQEAFPENLVGLYCNTSTWLSETSSKYGDFLWIASYGVDDPGIEADWKIWQYTSSPVDTDKAKFSSRSAMKTWALSKASDDDGDDDQGDDAEDLTVDTPESSGSGKPGFVWWRNNTDFTVVSQTWDTVDVTDEGHSAILTGPRRTVAHCWLYLTATEGSEIQGRFYKTDTTTGERTYSYPIAERIATRGQSFADFTLPVDVKTGETLRFEVKVFDYSATSVEVSQRVVSALVWN